jgi:hypothetical protein
MNNANTWLIKHFAQNDLYPNVSFTFGTYGINTSIYEGSICNVVKKWLLQMLRNKLKWKIW